MKLFAALGFALKFRLYSKRQHKRNQDADHLTSLAWLCFNNIMNKAVFLDRDGTLNKDVNYLTDIKDLEIFPCAFEAISLIRKAGFLPIVITNQSAVARGMMSENDLQAINHEFMKRFAEASAPLEAIYSCPHHPHGHPPYNIACRCRKPGTELFEKAAAHFGIDMAESWAIGDKMRDLTGPASLGCQAALISDGMNIGDVEQAQARGFSVCRDVLEAARIICGKS